MPKLTKQFFQKLNGNNIELQLLMAKQHGQTPAEFFEKMCNDIYNGQLNEDNVIKALKLNAYIKTADKLNNEMFENYDVAQLNAHVSLNNDLIKKYLSSQQMDKIYEAMDQESVGMIESMDENGNVELTKEAIQIAKIQKEQDAVKLKEEQEELNKIRTEEQEISDLRTKAKEEVDSKIQANIKNKQAKFNKDLMNGQSKDKVFFDNGFFQKMFDGYNPDMFGGNNGNAYEQIKTSVKNSINGLNSDKNSPGKQREVARNMLKVYMNLKNRSEGKSFSEKLRHPIDSLKEWGQKRKIESAIKNAYGFDGKTLDKIYNMSKYGIPEDLGYLKKDGTTVANRGSEQEIEKKFNELNKLRIARQKCPDVVKDDASLMKKLGDDINYKKGKEQDISNKKNDPTSVNVKQTNINIAKE